jgi:MFS family permease
MTSIRTRTWLLGVLMVGPFMAQADATIANVATPSIRADLGASGSALELVIGGYLIAFAVLLITGARLGQTHGYRRVLIWGLAAFSFASLLCGLAPTAPALIVARVLQGAAAALLFPQTLTGIRRSFEGRARVRAIGLYAIALSSGAVLGQLFGGALIGANLAGSGWRPIFLVNVPIGAVAAVAAARKLPADAPAAARGIDLAGVAMLSAGILLVVLPLVLGRAGGWPAWTWVSLLASGPVLAGFVVLERAVAASGKAPLVNLRAVARPTVAWALVALSAATATYYALLFTLAQYLQDGLGHSAAASGLTLVPWVAAFGVAGQIVPRMPARVASLVPSAGCLLLAAVYAAISAMLFSGEHREGALVALLALGGLGLGVQFSALIAHVSGAVAPEHAADISGVSTTMSQVGGALGVAGFGTLYYTHAAAGATHAFALVTAALCVVALLAAAGARRAVYAP